MRVNGKLLFRGFQNLSIPVVSAAGARAVGKS